MTAAERLARIRVKIEWSQEHFRNLEAARDRFLKSEFYTLDSKPNPKPGYENFNIFFPSNVESVPDPISLLAGDAIHNMRSALDHLACHLVDVGGHPLTISDRTAFPIFKGTHIDEASFTRQVHGMRKNAQDKIRSTEPYKDGKGHYLWVLHKLDIADKHHTLLTTVSRVGDITMHIEGNWLQQDFRVPGFAAPNFGDALEKDKPLFTCERGAEHNTELTFDIAIREPNVIKSKPVVSSIKYLIDKVDGLIGEFEPLLA